MRSQIGIGVVMTLLIVWWLSVVAVEGRSLPPWVLMFSAGGDGVEGLNFPWRPVDVFSTRSECLRERDRQGDTYAKLIHEPTRRGPGYLAGRLRSRYPTGKPGAPAATTQVYLWRCDPLE